MKAPNGYIIVKGERFDETFTTKGGLVLYRYLQEGNETKDVNYHCEVVAIPEDPGGGIAPDVKVGDKAYIHFNSFLKDHNFIITDEGNFWKIAYDDVFCVVRDGEIIPIGGWCLVEPELKKIETSLETKVVLEDGTILGEDIIEKSEISGILAYIGTPRAEWDLMTPMPKPGDKIAFSSDDAFENEIEGKNYYCMRQFRINGIYGEAEVQ